MLTLLATAALTVCVQDAQDDAATAAPQDEAKAELVRLTEALAKAESYSFTQTGSGSGGGFGRGGFGRGRGRGQESADTAEPPAPPVTRGIYKKNMPLQLSQGESVAYKDGEQFVYKNSEGKWELLDMESMRDRFSRGGQGGGRGRGRGGDEGGGRGGEEGGRGERGQGDRAGMESLRAVMGLRGAAAPHASLAGFADQVDSVTRSEKDGVITYTGDLTEEGAEALASAGRGGRGGFGGRGGRGGEGGPEIDWEGTYTITVKEGAIASVTYETSMFGIFGDREFERTSETEISIAEMGKAKLEVPEEALAQFEI